MEISFPCIWINNLIAHIWFAFMFSLISLRRKRMNFKIARVSTINQLHCIDSFTKTVGSFYSRMNQWFWTNRLNEWLTQTQRSPSATGLHHHFWSTARPIKFKDRNYLLILMGLFESLTITKNSGKKNPQMNTEGGKRGFFAQGYDGDQGSQ